VLEGKPLTVDMDLEGNQQDQIYKQREQYTNSSTRQARKKQRGQRRVHSSQFSTVSHKQLNRNRNRRNFTSAPSRSMKYKTQRKPRYQAATTSHRIRNELMNAERAHKRQFSRSQSASRDFTIKDPYITPESPRNETNPRGKGVHEYYESDFNQSIERIIIPNTNL